MNPNDYSGLAQNYAATSTALGASTPPTVTGALNELESIHKRLTELITRTERVADALSPTPEISAGGVVWGDCPEGSGVVSALSAKLSLANAMIDRLQGLTSRIETSLGV